MENDIHKLILLNSIDAIFEPHEWLIPEIRPIRSEEGEVLAYCSIQVHGNWRTRTSLPEEFFSHEMKEVDIRDADKFAGFMSRYGAFRHAWKPSVRSPFLLEEALGSLDASTLEGIDCFEGRTGFLPYESMMRDLGPRTRMEFYAIFKPALQALLDKLSAVNESTGKNVLTATRISAIFSPWQATYAFENWLYAADYVKALVASSSCVDVATRVGVDEIYVARNATEAMNIINEKLRAISPRIDLLEVESDDVLPADGLYAKGSIEEAIALQLWKMSILAKQGAFVCKECGEVFVTKRSKARKSSPRATSEFCCDRCKNRFTQREYRKSPGYRRKKEQLRQSSQRKEDKED